MTGSPSPAVRHIFAPAAENWKPVTTAFHALFECRHHARLVKRLFRDSPDRANNLIAMSGHLHALWAKGLIGLQPMGLSPDGKTLTVAIRFMLRSRSNCPKDPDASLVELVRPADRRMTASIVDVETGRKVRDGQIITFRQATVPESGEIIPVPNWDILQLQWMLVKAISLAGAATPFLDVEDGDDDGTGYGVHESFLEMQDHEDLDIEELRGVVYEVIDHDVYYSDDGQLPLNPKSPRTWSLHPSAGQ